MSEREVGGLEVPLGSLDNLGSSTGLIDSTASLAGLVLGNGRDADFYKIQRENRHRAIKIAIGLEAFTSFFEYIAEHPVSSIPDFAAALNRWRNQHPELAYRIPKYNKSKWERSLSISTKKDIESVFGIHFQPRVRKPMLRRNGGTISAEYLKEKGYIDLSTLERRLGKIMFGYVLLFVTSRENQFQFTITETGEKKSVVFQSVSGHTISFDEISDCVQHIKVTQFAKKDTKRLIVERPDVDFLLEMNFENVVSGWTEEFDRILAKYQRTTEGLSQGRLELK